MKKGLAVFSGTSAVHKLLQDGTVILGNAQSASVVQISGTLAVSSSLTVAASDLIIGQNHAFYDAGDATTLNLSGVLAAIKDQGTSDVSTLSGNVNTRFNTLEGIVEAAVSGGTGTGSAWFEGINSTLDSIREIANYLDGEGANATGILSDIGDLTTVVRGLTGSLDTANISVDGQSFAATSSIEITGSDDNIDVTHSLVGNVNTISVALKSSPSVAGTLTANAVTASAGLEVTAGGLVVAAGGATISAGGLAITAGGAVINGLVDLKDGFNVSGSTTLQGAATLQSTLSVDGVTTLTGELNANGGVKATTLSASSTLQVAGASTLLGVVTAQGGLEVTGSANFNNAVTLASTLNVTGISTLGAVTASSLEVNGAADVDSLTVSNGNLSVSAGNASISGTLAVTGSATFNSGVSVATGSAAVEHGTLKAVMVSGVDNLSGLYAASGSSNGKFFYLQGAADGGFPRGDCWYFCQNSEWFDAPFFGPEA